jgi:hypothetical protein
MLIQVLGHIADAVFVSPIEGLRKVSVLHGAGGRERRVSFNI